MWLGAARLNLPTIFLPGGPAYPGRWRGQETVFPTNVLVRGLNMVLSGELSEKEFFAELSRMESCWITCAGACPELTTANTTMLATEAMGLCLPGASTTPGAETAKVHEARRTGHAVMRMIGEGLTFDKVVTRRAILDAAAAVMAVSGSTNGILHLLTLGVAMDLGITLDDFQAVGDRTPYLCPLRPSGRYSIVDFGRAGGVMGLLNRLGGRIDGKRPTVSGKMMGELAGTAVIADEEVIRPEDRALFPTGGIVVMRGNLAPEGALVRHTVVSPSGGEFTGPAVCFDTQIDALMGILTGAVNSGDVMVIRYQGPRGGPGFSENFKVVLILDALGLGDVAVVTDSRFSGATEGALYAGYISPEAYVGGPLAAVRNGDGVTISVKNRRIDVDLTDDEIARRMEGFVPPKPRITTGVLVDWNLTATQFHEGAMLKRRL